MKKVLILALTGAAAMSLAACSQNSREQTQQAADAVGADVKATTQNASDDVEAEMPPRGTHRVVAPPPAPEPVSLRPIPEPQPAPAAAPEPAQPAAQDAPSSTAALEDRVAQLEARLEQQEAALRRVLTLLVDWTEIDNRTDGRGDGRAEARREAAATIRPGAWGHAA